MRTLQVTSPLMRGSDVKKAQQRLRTNHFKQNFMAGARIDGEFGPDTGRACRRAKYWLGYDPADQRPTYGETLDNFLSAKTPLPTKQKTFRATRLKAAKQTPLREKAFAEAVKDLGQKESPPNSNLCPISRAWPMQGPWCAVAVSTWYMRAGSKAFVKGRDWAYCPYLLQTALEGNRGLALATIANVKHGDVVMFDWEQNGVSDHTGLFDRWTSKGRTFRTIEGNTAVGNDSNGGEVMRRDRVVGNVAKIHGRLGFVHVGR